MRKKGLVKNGFEACLLSVMHFIRYPAYLHQRQNFTSSAHNGANERPKAKSYGLFGGGY